MPAILSPFLQEIGKHPRPTVPDMFAKKRKESVGAKILMLLPCTDEQLRILTARNNLFCRDV